MDTQIKLKFVKTKQIVLLMLLLIVFFSMTKYLTGCINFTNIDEVIKSHTDIEFPNEAKLLYDIGDTNFMHGRHANLSVYEFTEEPTKWLEENNFSLIKNESNEKKFWDYFAFATHDIADIPAEYVPNFKKDYLWLTKAVVFFYYYPDVKQLIVCISGT